MKRSRRRFAKLLLPLVVLLVPAAGELALAQDEPENVVKYRKALMRAQGAYLGAISGVARGEVGYLDHVAGHARALQELARLIPQLFPEGTGPDSVDTDALPSIWENQTDFEAKADQLEAEAGKLVKVAATGDSVAIAKQMANLGRNGCGACHNDYRKRQN